MLFAYALIRDGLQFPVPLQCGSDAARELYLQAIERARSSGFRLESSSNMDRRYTCECYNPERLDYLVQLGLFSMCCMMKNVTMTLLPEG